MTQFNLRGKHAAQVSNLVEQNQNRSTELTLCLRQDQLGKTQLRRQSTRWSKFLPTGMWQAFVCLSNRSQIHCVRHRNCFTFAALVVSHVNLSPAGSSSSYGPGVGCVHRQATCSARNGAMRRSNSVPLVVCYQKCDVHSIAESDSRRAACNCQDGALALHLLGSVVASSFCEARLLRRRFVCCELELEPELEP